MEIVETFREEQVEIGFTVIDQNRTFMDRFTLSKKDFEGMTEDDITRLKTRKYEDWLLELNAPPPNKQDRLNYLTTQITKLQAEKAVLELELGG